MLRSGPACHPNSTSRPQPGQTRWTPGTSSATLEPVTVPAGARAAHPPPDTPARDRPDRPAIPRFEGTSRRQDQETYMNRRYRALRELRHCMPASLVIFTAADTGAMQSTVRLRCGETSETSRDAVRPP